MQEQMDKEKSLMMSVEQVRAFDKWAIEEVGMAGVVLMENAGRDCAVLIRDNLRGVENAKVVIFCGTGNNGGDGFVIARHLHNSRLDVVTVVCGDKGKIRGDAKANLDILERLAGAVEELDLGGEVNDRVGELTSGADMLVDALFGTGLRGELSGEYQKLIEAMNGMGVPILAVDTPSGLDCETGEVLGAAIRARFTMTFAAMKKGFVENKEAKEYTGEIYLGSIGVEPRDWPA
jgi:hydroxyethylthiazole kinase-like uncharacterized protein yjeF